MFKAAITFAALITAVSVALSPALAHKGGGGGSGAGKVPVTTPVKKPAGMATTKKKNTQQYIGDTEKDLRR